MKDNGQGIYELEKAFMENMSKGEIIQSSYQSLKNILDHMVCAVCIKSIVKNEIVFINEKFNQNFGANRNQEELANILQQIEKDVDKNTCEICTEDKCKWYNFEQNKVYWLDGQEVILYILYEITEKKKYQRTIEQQTYTDFLTGLYNRMCCEKDLVEQVEYAMTNEKKGMLIYIDLDDFKYINDGIGHRYGDELLKLIAEDLKQVRGIRNTCYRVGGDEFIIIIPPTAYSQYEEILNNIQDIFKKQRCLNDEEYDCTASVGVVEFPTSGDDVQSLIKKADIAMYESKKNGKNKVTIFTEKMDSTASKRMGMQKNMRQAAIHANHEFLVFYQPVLKKAEDGYECYAAEALLRWNNAELGFVLPAEFVPLAEYLGLINPIGNYVLKEACKKCKEWNDNGYPDYKIAVNLSVVQLLQNDIVEIIQGTIQETQIAPANLILEVTESLAINDMERMESIIASIKSLGVFISLDDFGTGYSSLNHIRKIDCDTIKVDRAFVVELTVDPYAKSFIKVVQELGGTLGAKICVEGVETKEQYEILKELGVDLLQGYYFDRALPPEEFDAKYVYHAYECK